MKTTLLISTLIFNLINTNYSSNDEVFLCDSEGGKKYHYSKNCRGLSNCKHKIIAVSLKKAITLGKGKCG
ncbi:MAG: hypothetical protein KBS61_03610 [Chryseobacterium sp.]|nr:hypothetical protein [Candidatus Chryseobacterium enterohippi]